MTKYLYLLNKGFKGRSNGGYKKKQKKDEKTNSIYNC